MTTGTSGTYSGGMPGGSGGGGRPMLGRYVLVREIARSNDVVWEGIDPTMNRRLAIKELALDASVTGQARRERIERFYREARAAGAMNHPNIVTIHEVGEDRGRFFIAMEYLEGQTLRERLSVVGALPLSEAVGIASALCDALEYAHNQGVVHRDIKPDNIHILRGGQVKLTDFGIARIQHEQQLTVAGQVFGTPSYMAPEQVTGGTVDARTDLFSLGIVLYEMLTGRKPFIGDSVVTITYKILHDPTPAALGVAPEVEAVLQRALMKAPEGRFQSAAQFRAALIQAAALQRSGGNLGMSAATAATAAAYPAAGGFAGAPTVAGEPPFPQAQEGFAPERTQASIPGAPQVSAPHPVAFTGSSYGGGGTRRPILATLGLVVLFAALLTGAGWAVTTAYKNQQVQANYAHWEQAYAKAAQLYENRKYEEAATAFAAVRLAPGVNSETQAKATSGEVYCYRLLGQGAQKRDDLVTAEAWFQKAVDLAPADVQALEELSAIRKLRGLAGPVGPSDNARQNAPVNTPGSNLRDTIRPEDTPLGPLLSSGNRPSNAGADAGLPGAAPPPTAPAQTTEGFTAGNAQAAQQAAQWFQKGEQAFQSGDRATALRCWHAAVAAGPGSPAALQAQERITRYSYSDPLNGI